MSRHGLLLDQYSIRNAIVRLGEYGYTREKISEASGRRCADRKDHTRI
jgi:hypothetical protein